ncbi:MAG: hypothetical protein ACK55Z_33200, partial [bacterium]
LVVAHRRLGLLLALIPALEELLRRPLHLVLLLLPLGGRLLHLGLLLDLLRRLLVPARWGLLLLLAPI